MCALCTLHSAVLQVAGGRSNMRCSSSTTHKFMPFACVERAKPSDADDLQIDFELDQSPQKINLAGEVYCNGGSQPYLFQAVRKAMLNVVCANAEITHVPKQPLGNPRFTRAASELVLSKEATALKEDRVSCHKCCGCSATIIPSSFRCWAYRLVPALRHFVWPHSFCARR